MRLPDIWIRGAMLRRNELRTNGFPRNSVVVRIGRWAVQNLKEDFRGFDKSGARSIEKVMPVSEISPPGRYGSQAIPERMIRQQMKF